MGKNKLALRFLNGDYYIIVNSIKNKNVQIDISVTLLIHYHNLEYHASVSIRSTDRKLDRTHANIFIPNAPELPSMDSLLSEIVRISKQSKLFSKRDTLEIRFYRVGGAVTTRKYVVDLG